MTSTRTIFARNLSRLVSEKGIEQQTLAFALDVSPSIVSAWMLGKRFPRADKMQQLADYFHITISELIETPDKATPPENPKLAILYKRSRALTEKQLDIVNSIVNEMVDEHE